MERGRIAGLALAVLGVAMVGLVAGCGDGTTGPAADIDPALIGTWESDAHATDASGLPLCRFVAVELGLTGSGAYRFRVFDPVVANATDCPGRTLRSEVLGRWSVPTPGMITFLPSLVGGDDPVTLPYELRGAELVMGDFVVYTRASGS